jgi:PTS hybrid protein
MARMNAPANDLHVGLVLVSHSAALVEGLAALVGQVAGPGVPLHAVGGTVDGGLGTDSDRVLAALQAAAVPPGAVVLMDLGSSVLAVSAALEDLTDAQRACIVVVEAPLVEGAVAAGVLASVGADLADVARAAEEARNARKL